MAKATSKKDEVTVLDAVEEIPLEKQIDNVLVKHNVTDMVISGLKEKYGELRLKNVDDKEGYLEVISARKEVRSWGILAEKLTKKGRENAIAIQKKWLEKEREILGKIAEVQDPLDAEIKRYEDNLERIEQERIRKQEEAAINRQAALTKMGARYENGSFVLNDVSFDLSLIKEADEDVWENSILSKYRVQYEKNESVRLAEEKLKQEAEEKLRKEREEFELQQKKFQEQQEAFAKQQEDAERDKQELQRKASEEARQKMEDKRNLRCNELAALGMTFNFNYNSYLFQDVNVHVTEITTKTDDEWVKLIEDITPVIEDRKADAEVKRLEKIEADKKLAEEAAAKREREKIEEEQRQAKIKEEQEIARKAEEALKATDKQKWQQYLSDIYHVVIPEMKSPAYKTKIEEAGKLIGKMGNL